MTEARPDAAWEGKWRAHDATRRTGPTTAHTPGERPLVKVPAGKAWMLRWAWLISTGMLVLGGILMVIVLAGQGHRIGL